MKVFFDSTYFFTSIGIQPKGIPKDYLLDWLENPNNHQFVYSLITLFELQAKGAKYVQTKVLKPKDVTKGVNAINLEKELTQIPFWEANISLIAFELRELHNDFIDCIILASAFAYADVLVSEDKLIHNLLQEPRILKLMQSKKINPNFSIRKANQLVPAKKRS
ncbi:MAG: PIN domain-containing protein [Candidatus Hodarchaeota archaeon]